jgi:hypothetical protein
VELPCLARDAKTTLPGNPHNVALQLRRSFPSFVTCMPSSLQQTSYVSKHRRAAIQLQRLQVHQANLLVSKRAIPPCAVRPTVTCTPTNVVRMFWLLRVRDKPQRPADYHSYRRLSTTHSCPQAQPALYRTRRGAYCSAGFTEATSQREEPRLAGTAK